VSEEFTQKETHMDQERSSKIRAVILQYGSQDISFVLNEMQTENDHSPSAIVTAQKRKKASNGKAAQPKKRKKAESKAKAKSKAKKRTTRAPEEIEKTNKAILAFVKKNPDMKSTEIAEKLKIDPYYASNGLKTLRAEKLVKTKGVRAHMTYAAK
jgi:predicted HTH transcriptional regulator